MTNKEKGYNMYTCFKCKKRFKGYKLIAYCRKCMEKIRNA